MYRLAESSEKAAAEYQRAVYDALSKAEQKAGSLMTAERSV
jgi:hypothetical protein